MWWPWTRQKMPDCQVVLFTRRDCPLCDDAHALLELTQGQFGFSLRVVDIDGDEELVRLHGEQVPVVTVDGQIRFRGQVNRVLLTRLLRGRS